MGQSRHRPVVALRLPNRHFVSQMSRVLPQDLLDTLAELDMQEVPIRDLGPIRVFLKGPQTMFEYYEHAARDFGDSLFLIDDEKITLTYAEAFSLAREFATYLSRDAGVKVGDRVAIAARNCHEWFIAFMGDPAFL